VVTKQLVQRCDEDLMIFNVFYFGIHSCIQTSECSGHAAATGAEPVDHRNQGNKYLGI
jgi:hypothetical protein